LYYALEALNLIDSLHARVFAAIHVEKKNLSQAPAIVDWVVKQGVDANKFIEQFNSFASTTKATRARQLQTAYQVEGVPALGVAGRYYTDGALAKSMGRVLQVVEHLTDQIRRGS
jgi:thiol:disulfide interchange protein DsbA